MVDVSAKAETVREARAEAIVTMSKETLSMIVEGKHHKGDVFATAADVAKAINKAVVDSEKTSVVAAGDNYSCSCCGSR